MTAGTGPQGALPTAPPGIDHPGEPGDGRPGGGGGSEGDGTGRWGTRRSRVVSWYDPGVSAGAAPAMSGLEFLRAIQHGELPPPPIAALFAFEMRTVEHGRVVFACRPDESAYNPIGVVHGGLVCTLADTVAACAVHSTLDAGVAYTSIDLTVSYLRPVSTRSGTLLATGTVTKPGRRVAFSTAEVVDGEGRLVATATSSCLVMGPS